MAASLLAAPAKGLRPRAALILLALAGCKTVEPPNLADELLPSNHRNWAPNMALLPYARVSGRKLKVFNIRNCKYLSAEDYIVDHYDKTFDLDKLESVDFIIVPFPDTPMLAHTMLSFGFAGGQHLAVSVEVRLEQEEQYSPVNGALRQYELMYVVGDERDLIQLRALHRNNDVYLYRARATRQQARELLVDIMRRVNRLVDHPEFYDTLTNNCTTNIVRHINRLHPGRVPLDVRILLPGYSDRLAYDLGLIDTDLPFEQTKRRAWINDLARLHRDRPDFSARIRRRDRASEPGSIQVHSPDEPPAATAALRSLARPRRLAGEAPRATPAEHQQDPKR